MADKKVSELTTLTTVAPDDYIPLLDASTGELKRGKVEDVVGLPDFGWTSTGENWVFGAWDGVTGIATITVPTDATTKYTVDMWVRFSQATGGMKYGRIVSITTTTLLVRLYGGASLVNETITNPVYSPFEAPYGSPIEGRSKELDHKERATDMAITSSTDVEVPELAASFYVSAGMTIKVTFYTYQFTAPINNANTITLWNGAVGTGTKLQSAEDLNLNTSGAGVFGPVEITRRFKVTSAGTITIRVSAKASASNSSLKATATTPMSLLVERG